MEVRRLQEGRRRTSVSAPGPARPEMGGDAPALGIDPGACRQACCQRIGQAMKMLMAQGTALLHAFRGGLGGLGKHELRNGMIACGRGDLAAS